MKNLPKKCFIFLLTTIFVSVALNLAGIYIWSVTVLLKEYSPVVFPYVGILSEKLSKNQLKREHIQDVLSRLCNEQAIDKSAVLNFKNKMPFAVAKKSHQRINHQFYVEYPIANRGQTIGRLRIWPAPGASFEALMRPQNLLIVTGLLVSLWMLAILAGFAYFRKNLFGPISQIDKFITLIENDEFGRISIHSGFKEWQNLSRKLNSLNDKISDSIATLHMLFSVSQTLSSNIETSEVFNILAEIIQKKFEGISCSLLLLGEDGFLRIRSQRGLSLDFARAVHLKPGEGFAGLAFQKCEMIVVNDASKENLPQTKTLVENEEIASFVHIPLLVESKCVGILNVNSKEKEYFTKSKISTLCTLGEYLSIALRNAHLYERIKELNRRLETEVSITTRELIQTNSRLIQKIREMKALSDIAVFVALKANLSEIFEMIVEKVKELLSVQSAGFLLFSDDENELMPCPPFFGIKDKDFSRLHFRIDEAKILNSVLLEGKKFLTNDTRQSIDAMPLLANLLTINSLILVPLGSGKKPIGILGVANKFQSAFNQDDEHILCLIADRVAGIIENVRLYQELERRLRDLTALQEISSAISSEPVWEKTLRKVISTTTHAFNADLCALLYYDEKNKELVTQPGAYFTGGDEAVLLRIPVDDQNSLSAHVFRTGESFLSPDASIDLRIKSQTARLWDVRSLILVPLKAENRVIGVLRIGKHQANCYNKEHLRLATLIAHQSAIIIENAHLYDSLRDTKAELEELNKIKNEFISIVSHELRTPITTIKGFIKVILEGEVGNISTQQRKFLKIVDQSVDRLTILVTDLLDISRIESGQFKVSLNPVNPRQIIKNVINNISAQASAKKLKLEMSLPDKVPLVMADKERLTQVFDNLILNAVKFTPQDGTITVSAIDKGDLVVFSVADTGIGIEKKDHQKVFEKFYQVNSGSNRSKSGTGLGLAIVKSIVEIHGGAVWVESELGKGSNFQFIIPRAKTEIKDFREDAKEPEKDKKENEKIQ